MCASAHRGKLRPASLLHGGRAGAVCDSHALAITIFFPVAFKQRPRKHFLACVCVCVCVCVSVCLCVSVCVRLCVSVYTHKRILANMCGTFPGHNHYTLS